MEQQYVGKDFLSLPKPHHHVSRLLVLSVTLALILAITAALATYFFKQAIKENKKEDSLSEVMLKEAQQANSKQIEISQDQAEANQALLKSIQDANDKPAKISDEQRQKNAQYLEQIQQINN